MDIYEYYGIPIRPVNFQISTHTTLESLFGIWNLSQQVDSSLSKNQALIS